MTEQVSQLFGAIAKVVPFSGVFMSSSKTRHRDMEGNMRSVPEDQSVEGEALMDDMPESLEGTLLHRKGRSAMRSWKRRYVVLNLTDGGSLSCYRFTSKKHYPTRMLRKMYTKLHRRDSTMERRKQQGPQHQMLCIHLGPDIPWIVRDIVNDPAAFVVEVPASYSQTLSALTEGVHNDDNASNANEEDSMALSFVSPMSYSVGADDHMSIDSTWDNDQDMDDSTTNTLGTNGRSNNKPLRYYFHCPRKGNEKALWLRAFSALDRLSSESTKKRKLFGSLKHMARVSRIRSPISAIFARESLQLESDYRQQTPPYMISTSHLHSHTEVEELAQPANGLGQSKEYRVQPSYAYPHRWMTHQELRDEMVLPSLQFHDLRTQKASSESDEVGSLQVEVLQCLGLPRKEKAAESNAVVYCVCGSYAFATDVIPSCSNPIWLSKMRRACRFPIFHAYAKLYLGVFDDDGKKEKNDFIGRIALDLSRLRPGCTYDVTFPLRLSTHVYSRRQRGAIRLRFHLQWKNERKALLSYLPKQIRMPRRNRSRDHVTVLCSSPKAFRNVAVTVHGAHMPGRFSTNQLRAAIKEFNYTRIVVMRLMRQTVRNTVFWQNPAISLFVFLSWMRCIYRNEFSLVPAYVLSFLFLHLMKNYAKYGVELPTQRGFLPPTCEEMLAALLGGSDSQSIAPLDMYMQNSTPSLLLDDYQDSLVVETHKPGGKRILGMLGFLEGDEYFDSMTVDDNHLEFPYAMGVDYPRFSVKESLETRVVAPTRRSKDHVELKGSRDNSAHNSISHGGSHPSGSVSTKNSVVLRSDEEKEFLRDETSRDSPPIPGQPSDDRSITSLMEFRSCSSPPLREISTPQDHAIVARPGELPRRPMPEQNIDIRFQDVEGDKKLTITEELQEIKEKVHELTFHLFNDKAYVVKDQNAQVWGKPRRSEKKRGNYDANRDLEKTLNVGQYSHSNPVISRIGLYIEPIVTASMSLLCTFRALFNLFTWQDPFLSFLTSLGCAITIAVLLVFPWRLFMFVVGVVCVGPQNWFIRMYRERRRFERQRNPPKSATPVGPKDQPVFHGHAPANQPSGERRVTPACAHHVVVPYSPLMYQRFYDWPPEPQFSRVKADPTSTPAQIKKASAVAARSKSSPPMHPLPMTPSRKMHKRTRSNPVGMQFVDASKAENSDGKSIGTRLESEGSQTIPSTSPCSITSSPEVQRSWLQGKEHKKDR